MNERNQYLTHETYMEIMRCKITDLGQQIKKDMAEEYELAMQKEIKNLKKEIERIKHERIAT